MKWLLLFVIVLPMLFIKPFIGVILLAAWFWKFRGTIAQDVQPGAGKRAITTLVVLAVIAGGICIAREIHVAYLRSHPKTQYDEGSDSSLAGSRFHVLSYSTPEFPEPGGEQNHADKRLNEQHGQNDDEQE